MGLENLVGKPVDYNSLRGLCGNAMRFISGVVCTDGNESCPKIVRELGVEEWLVTIEMVNAVANCEKLQPSS